MGLEGRVLAGARGGEPLVSPLSFSSLSIPILSFLPRGQDLNTRGEKAHGHHQLLAERLIASQIYFCFGLSSLALSKFQGAEKTTWQERYIKK